MKQEDFLCLLDLFESNDIEVVVDGGWGVDALLGQQTRDHDDLDIAVDRKNIKRIREILGLDFFKELQRNDSNEYMFVLVNSKGLQVDVHGYEFDNQKQNIYGIEYPYDSLLGRGQIADKKVRCISPEYVVKFHSGYDLQRKDYDDVSRICKKFGIELPADYERFLT